MCSLGIEPTTFALLTQCSNHWATGTQFKTKSLFSDSSPLHHPYCISVPLSWQEYPCCLCWARKLLDFIQKYINLCSEDERRSYGFRIKRGWVINGRIFISLVAQILATESLQYIVTNWPLRNYSVVLWHYEVMLYSHISKICVWVMPFALAIISRTDWK